MVNEKPCFIGFSAYPQTFTSTISHYNQSQSQPLPQLNATYSQLHKQSKHSKLSKLFKQFKQNVSRETIPIIKTITKI